MARFKVTDMPVLTPDIQSQLVEIERKYQSILAGHCQTYQISDPSGALEKIRTFSTLFFDFYYSYYSKFPEHSEHWVIASEMRAMERIQVRLEDFTATRHWLNDSILGTIKTTIAAHAKGSLAARRSFQPIKPPEKIPTLGSAFANSEPSPLLRMAQLNIPSHVAALRKKFVLPLLDEKGWSIPEWAEKAGVSRHTANAYLNDKRKTNHANRKLLAEALGVYFQEFPK